MRGRGSICAADLHKTDHTPWDGHMLMERPSVTVLRSTVTVEGGQFLGHPKDGQFLSRERVAVEIRSWPVA